jgi:hypothetical protein
VRYLLMEEPQSSYLCFRSDSMESFHKWPRASWGRQNVTL